MSRDIHHQAISFVSSWTDGSQESISQESTPTKFKSHITSAQKKIRDNDMTKTLGSSREGSRFLTQPGSAIVASQMFKTKLCIDNQTKGCSRGDRCPYAHSVAEMRSLPDLRKTKMCSLVLAGKRCKNRSCSFAHSEDELRFTCGFAEFKTQICRFSEEHGGRGCLYGTRCPYAHSPLEIRPLETPTIAPTEILVEQKKSQFLNKSAATISSKNNSPQCLDFFSPQKICKLKKNSNRYDEGPSGQSWHKHYTPTKSGLEASHGQRFHEWNTSDSHQKTFNRRFFSPDPKNEQQSNLINANEFHKYADSPFARMSSKVHKGKRFIVTNNYPELQMIDTSRHLQKNQEEMIHLSKIEEHMNSLLPSTRARDSEPKAFAGGQHGIQFDVERSKVFFANTSVNNPRRSFDSEISNVMYQKKDTSDVEIHQLSHSSCLDSCEATDYELLQPPPGLRPFMHFEHYDAAPKCENGCSDHVTDSTLLAAAMQRLPPQEQVTLLQFQERLISELQRKDGPLLADSVHSFPAAEQIKEIIGLVKAAASLEEHLETNSDTPPTSIHPLTSKVLQ